ncbi:unnamed protein product [Amoebophrya sp. A120]|nr:unnamed protein product [Amoebophrya sp. A120]|eukprot:GSA120T00024432001.1
MECSSCRLWWRRKAYTKAEWGDCKTIPPPALPKCRLCLVASRVLPPGIHPTRLTIACYRCLRPVNPFDEGMLSQDERRFVACYSRSRILGGFPRQSLNFGAAPRHLRGLPFV